MIEAEREQLAVHYAEAALKHSKHSPPSDYVRVTSAVAPLDFKLGNRTRALELLAHAEQRIVQNLESDKHSAWYLDIARAYSRINEAGQRATDLAAGSGAFSFRRSRRRYRGARRRTRVSRPPRQFE